MKPVSILSILASTSAFEYTTDYGKWTFIQEIYGDTSVIYVKSNGH